MADFTVIETQEQLDAVIKSRLSRAQEKHAEEMAALQAKIDELTKTNAELADSAAQTQEKFAGYDEEVKGYKDRIAQLETDGMKRRIAYESGLPIELANRLNGTTEDEIKADAQSLSRFARLQSTPLAATEPVPGGDSKEGAKTAALRKLANSLTGGNE